jgi:formylglycine-generating enzyme required for sulfatase activity
MGSNPSYFKQCGDDCPVEQVSWDDAQSYVRKLNEKLGGGSVGPYRLPSESEWEYGCRGAASQTEYCGSNNVDAVAWYDKNSGRKTHRVGTKQGSGYGLYDISGNIWEWTQDCYKESYEGAPTDGSAVMGSYCAERALRGGSWNGGPATVTSANRFGGSPASAVISVGFRVARTLP